MDICAYREEENGGMNPGGGGSKNTAAPEQHAGLESADVVPSNVWNGLLDPEGLPFKFARWERCIVLESLISTSSAML